MTALSVYGFTTLAGAGAIETMGLSIRGYRLSTVLGGGCAAIVSSRPPTSLIAGSRRSALNRLKLYQRVLETVMVFAPILPARFETLMMSEAQLRLFLNRCGSVIADPLSHYGSLVQFEIAVSWSAMDAIARLRSEGVIGLKFAEGGKSDASTTLALQSALEGHRQAQKDRIRAVLARVAQDVIETHYPDPNNVANFTVLVRRGDEPALRALIAKLGEDTGEQLQFRLIGPLPACSFAAVEIGNPSPQSVRKARRHLSVGEALSPAELKRAYRKAVKALHPDLNPKAQQRGADLDRIRQAYALLSSVARGQAVSDGRDLASGEPVHLDPASVEKTFTMRLCRMDGGQAEAA